MSSPQGRFTEGARLLDGGTVEKIEAVGKHLLYHWDRRPILHVHLGLFGRFTVHRELPPPPPSPNARLALVGDAVVYLSGPTICELLDPLAVEHLKARLGPDPLDPAADPQRFFDALDRRGGPVAAALLDQSAIAGIGNVYRSELLFLTGIHPDRPANLTTRPEREDLWQRSIDLLGIGERLGRIVTTDPRTVGVGSHRDIPKSARLWVYKRRFSPCYRCGTEIHAWDVGGRSVWACPSCQA